MIATTRQQPSEGSEVAMRRFTALLCVASLVLVHPSSIMVQAQTEPCWECAPELWDGIQVSSGTYTMCVDPTALAGKGTAIQEGIDYWTGYLSQNGRSIQVDVVERDPADSSCNMKVYGNPNMPATIAGEAVGSASGQGAYMTLKNTTTTLARDDRYWKELAAHEFGHILGFAPNNVQGCKGKTVMSVEWLWDGTGNSFPDTSPMCGDIAFATWKYAEPQPGYESDSSAAGEDYEECYDRYYVVDYYYRLGPVRE